MRQVFTPPEIGGGWQRAVFGAILLTASVFLVLPLTQMSSAGRVDRQLTSLTAATVEPPPPPPVIEEPEPEEEPEEEPEPEPVMEMESTEMSIDIPSLEGLTGTGPAINVGSLVDGAAPIEQEEIFDVTQLDNKPTLVGSVKPVHPKDLLKQRVEGSVVLQFVVNEEGRVEDPRVESASRPEFEKPALEAVRRWKFKPGMREGEPVSAYVRQRVSFGISS